MKTTTGNLFDQECDAICITTNGFTKANGSCVMGRGCALEAAKHWPEIPVKLGWMIRKYGNRCMKVLDTPNYQIVSFPVKPIKETCLPRQANLVKHMRRRIQVGQQIPGWACVARLEIIERSAKQLVEMADKFGWESVVLPYPGCGAGELEWIRVRPVLEGILDDRFTAITF
jgi:O-acetyl-ADP-ribose deacetylase (regulator of RNase III)